jgi:hypothetical protein
MKTQQKGDYSSIASSWTEIFMVFGEIFGFFHGILTFILLTWSIG